MPAPIAIFAYNRPEHTKRLLKSLWRNPEFRESPVHIYCDGPKASAHASDVAAVRAVVREMAPPRTEFVMRDHNLGLANSVIAGVSDACARHGRVIVCEDDLVVSPVTLRYFNDALQRYMEEERVMHIAGYMFPVDCSLPQTFFYREASCWGWATWARAWKAFDPNPRASLDWINRKNARHAFNIDGSMQYYAMLKKQAAGRIDSWAIRWYASVFRAGGLALHPGQALIENRGFDGSGVHCNTTAAFDVDVSTMPITEFPQEVVECRTAVDAMIRYRSSWVVTRRNERKAKGETILVKSMRATRSLAARMLRRQT